MSKVEGTESRSHEVIRKHSLHLVIDERKNLEHREGVTKYAAQVQIPQRPRNDGDSAHTVVVLERDKQFLGGRRGYHEIEFETEDERHGWKM